MRPVGDVYPDYATLGELELDGGNDAIWPKTPDAPMLGGGGRAAGATAGGPGFGSAGDTAARLLMAPPSPAEDPFTGSATGCLGAYLWHEGLIEAPAFTAEQGHGMGRPGQAKVEALGPREAPVGVRVEGAGVVLMRGELEL